MSGEEVFRFCRPELFSRTPVPSCKASQEVVQQGQGPTRSMKLLLFDIDGTLLRTNGVGKSAVTKALSAFSEASVTTEDVPFSGRTDPAIFQDVLAKNELPTTNRFMRKVIDRYVQVMQKALSPENVDVLPGVPTLLAELNALPDVQLGLVTGNVEPIAYAKLSTVDLDKYFPFGSFGSDHSERAELPAIAARRASTFTGQSFRLDEHAVLVGDTVHDIRCGQAVDACVVSVCTGRYERHHLHQHTPDLVLDSLRHKDAFFDYVMDS